MITKTNKAQITEESTSEIQKISNLLTKQVRPLPEDIPKADWSRVDPGLQKTLIKVIAEDNFPLYLFGDQGRGKTCASACLYASFPVSHHKIPRWFRTSRIIRDIQSCRTNPKRTVLWYVGADRTPVYLGEKQIVEKVRDSPIVFFDDVGIRDASESVCEIFLELLDARAGRKTVFTGNNPPDELSKIYDGRIASRILSGSCICLKGKDRRINPKITLVEAE